jgi:hypothetical protein
MAETGKLAKNSVDPMKGSEHQHQQDQLAPKRGSKAIEAGTTERRSRSPKSARTPFAMASPASPALALGNLGDIPPGLAGINESQGEWFPAIGQQFPPGHHGHLGDIPGTQRSLEGPGPPTPSATGWSQEAGPAPGSPTNFETTMMQIFQQQASMQNQAMAQQATTNAGMLQMIGLMQEQIGLIKGQPIQHQAPRDTREFGPREPQVATEPTSGIPYPKARADEQWGDFPPALLHDCHIALREWRAAGKVKDRAKTKTLQLKHDIDIMKASVGSEELIYPKGVKKWQCSQSFTDMDKSWRAAAVKELSFESVDNGSKIVIPQGTTRRDASSIFHHSLTMALMAIELESCEDHYTTAHRNASFATLKARLAWEINEYCKEINSKHAISMEEIGSDDKEPKIVFTTHRVEAFINDQCYKAKETMDLEASRKKELEEQSLAKQKAEETELLNKDPQSMATEAMHIMVNAALNNNDAMNDTGTFTTAQKDKVLKGLDSLNALLSGNGFGTLQKEPDPKSRKSGKGKQTGKGKSSGSGDPPWKRTTIADDPPANSQRVAKGIANKKLHKPDGPIFPPSSTMLMTTIGKDELTNLKQSNNNLQQRLDNALKSQQWDVQGNEPASGGKPNTKGKGKPEQRGKGKKGKDAQQKGKGAHNQQKGDKSGKGKGKTKYNEGKMNRHPYEPESGHW